MWCHVTYRVITNRTSSLLTADQVLGYIEEWRGSSGTFLHNDVFRSRLIKECSLEIDFLMMINAKLFVTIILHTKPPILLGLIRSLFLKDILFAYPFMYHI